jgi:hypothetical protein
MSELILPGSDLFNDVMKEVSPPVIKDIKIDLIDHTVMLNTAKLKTFQCGGLCLGPKHLIAKIGRDAQQEPIRRALLEDKLIDMTDKDLSAGFKHTGGETTAIIEEDLGYKVYIQKSSSGETIMISPKNEEQRLQFEAEIKEFGYIKNLEINIEEQITKEGLSSIFTDEVWAK